MKKKYVLKRSFNGNEEFQFISYVGFNTSIDAYEFLANLGLTFKEVGMASAVVTGGKTTAVIKLDIYRNAPDMVPVVTYRLNEM